MPHPLFDRSALEFRPVKERRSEIRIRDIAVDPDETPDDPGRAGAAIDRIAERVIAARQSGAPVVICHGAHLIKNGLGPLLIRLVQEGWLQHVATNGAGSIHDWEFGHFGESCEDVRAYVAEGQFGIWEETGATIGLSLLVGALDGLGYGESVGRTIVEERLVVPSRRELRKRLQEMPSESSQGAAAADLLETMDRLGVAEGERSIPHESSEWSVQAACYRAGVPFTVHPGVGQDIIYTHPLFHGGAVGRTALRDFLIYAETIRRLPGGVYLSVGSSVMSPMIFEKSVSMARNLARQDETSFDGFFIAVNDLAEVDWDWSRSEPPADHPAYYVRFLKSFSRMGGEMEYVGLDNRVFMTNLYQRLRAR